MTQARIDALKAEQQCALELFASLSDDERALPTDAINVI